MGRKSCKEEEIIVNIASIKALFKKEISDIFRDKKTIFTMMVIPLVLYPLLMIGMTMLFSSIMANQVETVYKVSFENVPCETELKQILEDESEDFTYQLEIVEVKDVATALETGEIDAYVSYVKKDGSNEIKDFIEDEKGLISLDGKLKITYFEAKEDSDTACKALEELLGAYQEQLRTENIRKLNLDEEILLHPLPYSSVGLSSVEETMGRVVGGSIPMMIIVSIMMGAIYPAIDVTAGEKERGTLETLLTLPVTNLEMIASKFLAVAVIACVSAVLNILSMGAAFAFMMSMLGSTDGEAVHINFASFIPAVLITTAVMITFALFVTAVCLCVCVFAKSFKEANNYITPVMFIFMFGGFAGMIPNLELTSSTAAMPVINVALLIKQLFEFKFDYGLLGIVFVTNITYSFLVVLILSKIYNSEAILFSEDLSGVKLVKKRSEMTKGQMPGIGDVILLCGVSMLLLLYAGSLVQLKFGLYGVAMTQGIIIAVPLVYAWYIKSDFKTLFSMKAPKISQLFGSLCIWIGGYSFVLIISVFLSLFMKESAQNINDTFAELLSHPTWMLILIMALLPAICEEILFRGFLYGTFKGKMKRIEAVILVSCLFGIYHMSLIKFFTTTLLGIMFVYCVSETDSIFCSMLMHFCNNALSVLVSKNGTVIKKILPVLYKERLQISDICILLAVGILFVSFGVFILKKSKKSACKGKEDMVI